MTKTWKTRSNQHPRRRLEVTIDSMTTIEMVYALQRVIDNIKRSGDGWKRFQINDSVIEMELSTYSETEYRIELINGRLCYIFKSAL